MECLLCQFDKGEVFFRIESFDYPLVYYRCLNCGLIYQPIDQSQAADSAFYEETYRRIYQTSAEPTAKDLWVQKQRAEHILGFLQNEARLQPKRILDIGASSGTLLATFKEKYHSEVVGVEPGDAYRSYAEDQGIKMFYSFEDLTKTDIERFDLVSMMHVLEHLTDPLGTLKKIRTSLLSNEGYLILEVPNFYAHDSYELAHLTCFTLHTLKEIVRQAGFEIMTTHRHGVPRSAILNLYLLILAKPIPVLGEPPDLKPDRYVVLKRRLGMLYRRFIQKVCPKKAWLPLPAENES